MARHNLCPNPAAKTTASNWFDTSLAAPTRVTGLSGYPRTTGGQITGGGGAGEYFIIPAVGTITAGQTYTGSAYHATSTAQNITPYLLWLDDTLTAVGPETEGATLAGAVNTVRRSSVTGTAPPGATRLALQISMVGGAGTLTVTAALIEQTADLLDYFDGDSPGGSWDGTDGNSTSTLAEALTLTDTPRPAQLSAPASVHQIGITVLDNPSAARSGGTTGVYTADLTGTDHPGAASLRGTTGTYTAGITGTDHPTAVRTHGTHPAAVLDTLTADTPGAVTVTGQPTTLHLASGDDLQHQDTPASVRAGGRSGLLALSTLHAGRATAARTAAAAGLLVLGADLTHADRATAATTSAPAGLLVLAPPSTVAWPIRPGTVQVRGTRPGTVTVVAIRPGTVH